MGIFNDPNDLSVVLVVGMTISLARFGERGPLRLLWLVPLGVMGYALTLTRSRGGFLALLAALLALLVARLGARKALLVAAVVLPALIVVFGGRQTSIDLSDQNDTSQHRIRLWRDGLALLRTAPVFGVGAGRYEEEVGLVAHNSFVHAYTELGILGGTLFAAAFVHPIMLLHRLGARKGRGGHPALQGLAPTVLACVAGMVGGMMSLSRVYTLTPYLILGLVAVYLRLATQSEPSLAPRLTPRLVGRFLVISVLLLGATDVFVRIFAGTG
jgi:O-antigen ligase